MPGAKNADPGACFPVDSWTVISHVSYARNTSPATVSSVVAVFSGESGCTGFPGCTSAQNGDTPCSSRTAGAPGNLGKRRARIDAHPMGHASPVGFCEVEEKMLSDNIEPQTTRHGRLIRTCYGKARQTASEKQQFIGTARFPELLPKQRRRRGAAEVPRRHGRTPRHLGRGGGARGRTPHTLGSPIRLARLCRGVSNRQETSAASGSITLASARFSLVVHAKAPVSSWVRKRRTRRQRDAVSRGSGWSLGETRLS